MELIPPPPHQPAQSADCPPNAAPAKLSKGEKLFDLGVYGGIAGILVFIATIPITYWTKYKAGEGRLFKGGIKALQKIGFGKHTAEQIMTVNALSMSGNIAIVPVKIAENHKVKIVDALNKKLGDDTDISVIEAEPKQTWMSLIKARILAWTSVFVSFEAVGAIAGKKRFEAFEHTFSEHIVCKPLNKPTHIHGEETPFFRKGKIAALDVFATIAGATLLFIGSRLFARAHKHKKHPKETEHTITDVMQNNQSATPQKPFSDAIKPREVGLSQGPLPSYRQAVEANRQSCESVVTPDI